MNDLAIKAEPKAVIDIQPTGDPLMDMAQVAVRSGDTAMLKEILSIRNGEDDRRAEMAFNAAYSKAQAEMPIIPKRGTGHNNIRYARLEDIMQAAMPVLAKHGLSLRHTTDNKDGLIKITATLSHVDGHFETDSISAAADTSGSKNSIQAIKSTITYLRRATAENILGLASHGEDDDAFSTESDFDTTPWTERILAAESMEQLKAVAADLKAEEMPKSARTILQSAWAGRAKEVKADA